MQTETLNLKIKDLICSCIYTNLQILTLWMFPTFLVVLSARYLYAHHYLLILFIYFLFFMT